MRRASKTLSILALLICSPAWAGPVNINTASAAELDKELTGIGPALAARIVEYRERHGHFVLPEDIQAVPYIGSKTFLKNQENILVKG